MALDKIPIVDWETLETHYEDRYRNQEEAERFAREAKEAVSKNEPLGKIVELLAYEAEDPSIVYRAVCTALEVVSAQLEVDELNDMAEVRCAQRRG